MSPLSIIFRKRSAATGRPIVLPRPSLPGLAALLLGLVLPAIGPAATGLPVVDHRLEVALDPGLGHIEVNDRMTLPAETSRLVFHLHADLEPELRTTDASLVTLGSDEAAVPVRHYAVTAGKPGATIELAYRGRIRHPVTTGGKARGSRDGTPGLIAEEGVFLGMSSYWYPVAEGHAVSFTLRTRLPEGWSSVSQGEPLADGAGWRESQPQDDIYLVAAPFHVYRRPTPVAAAEVYLRQDDPQLAEGYLQATADYLDLYQALLGDYPYAKFALVENFWESGYGMPSFTLLGPRVIRLPFIIHTSYPHEIVHNWWGNGVYVDYATGNWSEGLTSYLADHLLKEQQGQGAAYRRDTLQNYAAYVSENADFPLAGFRGRHGEVSQAVGYGKALMMYHMLRQRLGDRLFLEGLRAFYRANRFQVAGFDQLRTAFETVSGEDLSAFFRQWTGRVGAPALSLGPIEVTPGGDGGYRLEASLRQTQDGEPFLLRVPVYVQVEGKAVPRLFHLEMNSDTAELVLELRKRPLHLAVDPRYDLFRRLDPGEIPSNLGQLFGAERLTLVLPADAPRALRKAYELLAEMLAGDGDGVDIVSDDEIDELPGDRPVWLLGAENRFARLFSPHWRNAELELPEGRFPSSQYSSVITLPHPADNRLAIGLVTLNGRDEAPLLARKLPHYGKYSYLVFEGGELVNQVKGRWPATGSPLSRALAGDRGGVLLPPEPALTDQLKPAAAPEVHDDEEEDCD